MLGILEENNIEEGKYGQVFNFNNINISYPRFMSILIKYISLYLL